jgi:hypothetical protein
MATRRAGIRAWTDAQAEPTDRCTERQVQQCRERASDDATPPPILLSLTVALARQIGSWSLGGWRNNLCMLSAYVAVDLQVRKFD